MDEHLIRLLVGLAIIGIFVGGFVIINYRNNHPSEKMKQKWKELEQDEDYQRKLEQRRREQQLEFKKKYNGFKLTCPVCGSHYIKNISSADKAVSVAFWGLASNQLNKQYQCEGCKHKF